VRVAALILANDIARAADGLKGVHSGARFLQTRFEAAGEEGRISFLKKRNKKLLLYSDSPLNGMTLDIAKVFWFFFSKKNCFLLP
jgi:hypothetical protein